MRVRIDEDACAGTGQCEMICPEVFVVDTVSRLLTDTPPPDLHATVQEAADNCPTAAIIISNGP
ncbi:MAG: ferredoxin [Actinobacteria bacterium]|nr:ferredoxin [Actinomycetota bacterium]MCI0543520.1 ferredoxin [Actinomycetota bacterium]MCI0679273.1 ferredoxin [Actinomycetota bacterium]